MKDEFSLLAETLRNECRRRPVYYLPNPGNWGDALIRHGTLKFFHDNQLEYMELTNRKKDWIFPLIRGGVVIYGGGGAWCELWDVSRHIVMLNHRFKVIVLPSTFESSYAISSTRFFCRDLFESRQRMPDANFCHDMAFYIGDEFSQSDQGRGKGNFFRRDEGSSNRIEVPTGNRDISAKGNQLSKVSPFFREINRFEAICTDRLHVAIAACLLAKEVHLYPGSYFKNRAVYLSSMKENFENAFFHEDCIL